MSPSTSLVRKGVKSGVSRGKPLGLAVLMSARGASRDVRLSVVDAGDQEATLIVSRALNAPVRAPVNDDLIVCVLGEKGDLAAVEGRLEDQRRAGGDVLVVVVGDSADRRRHIEALRAAPDLGVGVAFPLDRLDAAGCEELRDAVVRRLGPGAVAASRASEPLRDTATRGLVRRGAVRAGVIGAVSGSRASSSVLTALQARLAADVGNLAGDQPQAIQAGEAVGTALAAPVWRQLARGLSAALPRWRPAVRAGVASLGTLVVGLVAARLRRVPTHSEASREER